tara:strand:- start:219 stop:527 length:309 start_codon:yes stop_codon:yes gene_type:complete
MNARNIQEYVVQNIFTNMKYRDEEVAELKSEMVQLKKVLRKLDAPKCPLCEKYKDKLVFCEACEIYGCDSCVRKYSSGYGVWDLCSKCVTDKDKGGYYSSED